MNLGSGLFVAACILFSFCGGESSGAQGTLSIEALAEQARREYTAGKFSDAERDYRELPKRDPSNVEGYVYLGQSLFRLEKYSESVRPYEKARELERNGSKLTSDQHRILVDQLVMAYGMSGEMKKARSLLDDAIQKDPEYPLNYYNLACVSGGWPTHPCTGTIEAASTLRLFEG